MADVTHHEAELGDVRIHYVTAGSGPPLVLLHGWPQTWYTWRHVIDDLAGQYFVVAPDLRGLGDSSRPVSGYDKRTVADDVWRVVSRDLELRSFYLVGHDWGGLSPTRSPSHTRTR
ncbi:alpha/beta fold hydrolase [Bradyrhizobium pachyrhizi]|uniref:alpha/beta fold hydrolase n=1 Tax=Bradyrhizobium pachyrhizi TaxID=280333 RepID=UPI003D36A0DF